MNFRICRYEGLRISATNTPPRKRSGYVLDFVDEMIFFSWRVGIDYICKIVDAISRSPSNVLALGGVCSLYDVPIANVFQLYYYNICHFFKSSLGRSQRANVEGCSGSGNMYISAGISTYLFPDLTI